VAQGPADWSIAHQMLNEEHLLGAGREAGVIGTKDNTPKRHEAALETLRGSPFLP
jgi:hypothetical protein